MNQINNFIRITSYFISFRMAMAGAVIMGGIVYFINADHGFYPALTAALKQGAYTFFLGGVLIRINEYITTGIRKRNLAIILAMAFTSLLTIGLIYAVHSFKGTPEPFNSTLPTIFLAPPGFFIVAVRKRRLSSIVENP